MGAALAANTGAAGAMHRVGFFAAKAAPTGYEDRLRIQLSVRQRSPKGWAISHSDRSQAAAPLASATFVSCLPRGLSRDTANSTTANPTT